jgi:hypothetical protein
MTSPTVPARDRAETNGQKGPAANEAFWQRYSPHHEFPVSVGSSTFVHAMAIAVLFFGGFLLSQLGLKKDRAPVPVDGLSLEGTGDHGNPHSTREEAGNSAPAGRGEENIPQGQVSPVARAPKPSEELKEPQHKAVDLFKPLEASRPGREIDLQEGQALKQLAEASRSAREKLEKSLNPANGPPGLQTGARGPGKKPAQLQRAKRQNRWVMVFNTQDGADYLRQLRGLGAILAIPAENDGYLVIRDLDEKPVKPKLEDLGKIDRIYWIDDQPRSVEDLAKALGLTPAPTLAVAFFPEAVEKDLLEKELAAFRGSEDEIRKTVFTVRRRGNRYEPVVTQQEAKK